MSNLTYVIFLENISEDKITVTSPIISTFISNTETTGILYMKRNNREV